MVFLYLNCLKARSMPTGPAGGVTVLSRQNLGCEQSAKGEAGR